MLQETELPKLGTFAKDVIFHGAVSFEEIPNVYAKAAVCVFPSHMETLGLVAPEAMVMEKPVIFTKLGPGPEVVVDDETGWLCDPHNPQDIANKIIQGLSNPHKASEIAKKGRLSVLQQFEINKLVMHNIVYYRKIVDFK
jgi:glycosyltransferase involved in cell wall biosynthesis